MKWIIFIIIILLYNLSFSQINFTAKVKDSQTGEVLPYCNVSVLGTGKGTITNADGVFSITADPAKDVLEFSYLGYETKAVFASYLKNDKNVYLKKTTYELQEVEIHADNDYLYKILLNSRKTVKNNYVQDIAKSYYCVETKVTPLEVIYPNPNNDSINNVVFLNHVYKKEEQSEKTAEILECLYNVSISGAKINHFDFRNGRAFMPPPEENYFMTRHSSMALGQFCYFEENENFPSNPFQYNKKTMKKVFNLELLGFDGKNYHIGFYPYNDIGESFSGEVWIEKETLQVLKISLNIENSKVYPFETLYSDGVDKINIFNLSLTYSFNPEENFSPNYTNFDYDFIYVSRRDTIVRDLTYKRTTSKINSKGLIYYYDYNKSFVLPYFEYDYDFDDYMLMSFIPYNEILWNSNDIVQLTQIQKQQIGISDNNVNKSNNIEFKDGKILLKKFDREETGISGFNYVFWSGDKRVVLSRTSIMDEITKDIQQTPYPYQLYNIEVQILLDVTEVEDSIVCKSWTVFDTMKSYYKYEETELTRAFLNIYFDICEIERRKMQKQLDENKYSLSEIEAVYNSTKIEMEKITKQFVMETDRGREDKFIKKWNKYVLENLGIDNLELIKNTGKSKN